MKDLSKFLRPFIKDVRWERTSLRHEDTASRGLEGGVPAGTTRAPSATAI
jgi:hypothetical protein